MASILNVRDVNNNVVHIPAIRGEKGDPTDLTVVPSKGSVVDGDGFLIADSADSKSSKLLLWSTIKAIFASRIVPSAANNVALLDSSGNLVDSGKALTPAGIGAAVTSHTHTASMITGLPTGKKVARFVVGTSTAGWTSADCDYLCDGTADQVEINAAITALPATGGEIVILDGTYNITAKIDIAKDNVSIRGNGNATILKRMFSSSVKEGVITLTGRSGCKIANLQIDGNKASYTNNNSAGIFLYSSSNNTVTGNTCNNNNNQGISLDASSNSNTVTGNTCNNNSCGIYLDASSNNTVTGNNCNNNSAGIFLYSSSNNTVTGNTCIRGTGLSTDYTASQHTIWLSGTGNSYNLIAMNNCMGKAVTNEGGTGNTLVNNKFDAT